MLIFLAAGIYAADAVEASASVNKKELELGDVVRYTITVKRSMQGGAVITRSPDITPPSFEGFRVSGNSSSSSVSIINNNANVVTTRHYDLVAIKQGEVVIQPAKVKFYDPEQKKEETIETKPVTMNVVKGGVRYKPPKPTPTTQVMRQDIREIKMKLDFRLSDFIPFIALGVIFILALMAAAYFIFRKRPDKKSEEIKTDYRAEAMKRLRKTEELLRRGDIKGFYYDIYETVRYFISRHFMDSFDELTTREIVRKLKDKKAGQKETEEIKNFMKDCDIVKFADYMPKQAEIDEIYSRAESIILKMQ